MHPAPQHPRNSPYPTGRSTLQVRGKLALLVPLLALAILLLVPALVFAEAPATPGGLSATSGDGTMDLSWLAAENATGGYQYRYATEAAAFQVPELCGESPECEWTEATTSRTITTFTIPKGTLTVGTTYFFQVRAVNTGDDPDTYSEPSKTESAVQRATPPAVENLAGIAGSQQVTLTWTHLSDSDIINYEVNRFSGGVWTEYQTTTDFNVDGGTVTHTVTELVNGTTYSFQVRGKNSADAGDDSNIVSATPSGPPAAPASLTAQEKSAAGTEVRLNWADPTNPNIDSYQYRYRVSGDGSAWGPGTTGDEGWANVQGSGASTTDFTVTGLT